VYKKLEIEMGSVDALSSKEERTTYINSIRN
jgi:hypothetical protein